MSITFEIGVDLHKQLLSGCDPSSAEYRTLINGCIEERIIKAHIVEVVQIVCGREEAELILNLAASACPKAAEIIQNALKGYEWCRYRASSTTECLENLRLGRLHRAVRLQPLDGTSRNK